MGYLRNFFKIFDFGGQEVRMNVDGRSKFKSQFGGVLGIICIGLIIGSGWSIGKDIFYHQEPQLTVRDVHFDKRPSMILDAETFPVSFCMQAAPSNVVFYNTSYFKYVAQQVTVDNAGQKMTTREFETQPCRKDHFPKISNETFYSSGLNYYTCIQNQNVTISGYFDEPFTTFLNIRLLYCVNDTKCVPFDEINDLLSKTKWMWNLYVVDSYIDISNYTNPATFQNFNIYRTTQMGVSKLHEVNLENLSSITDVGYIFNDYRESTSISFKSENVDSSNSVSDFSLYDFYIFSSNKHTVYTRRYVKAQTIAANLGGIIKFLLVSCYCTTYFFHKHKLYSKLINHCADIYFDEKTNEKNSNNFRKSSSDSMVNIQNLHSINVVNVHNRNNFNNDIVKNNIECKVSNFKKIKLKFSHCEVIKKYLCGKKVAIKKYLFYEGEKFIEDLLNVLNIVTKLDEVDKFKLLLLEPDQILLFDHMSKFDIGWESGTEISKLRKRISIQKDKNSHKMEVDDAVKEIVFKTKTDILNSSERRSNKIDQKLLEFLSNELK